MSAPIILDTNVISELFKPEPDPSVIAWFARQDAKALFLTAFTIAELRAGAEMLAQGKKRKALERWIGKTVLPLFEGRILPFDTEAAEIWGKIVAADKRKGKPRPTIDAMIAAIALVHEGFLATRNVADFKGTSLRVLNPFEVVGKRTQE